MSNDNDNTLRSVTLFAAPWLIARRLGSRMQPSLGLPDRAADSGGGLINNFIKEDFHKKTSIFYLLGHLKEPLVLDIMGHVYGILCHLT